MRNISALLITLLALSPASASAEIVCRKKNGSLVVRKVKCGRSERSFSLASVGAVGPQGPDGAFRIYGDGSAGAFDHSEVAENDSEFPSLLSFEPSANFQFSSFTVRAGAILGVKSGTFIRVAGPCVIAGRIQRDSQGFESSGIGGLIITNNDAAPTTFFSRPASAGLGKNGGENGTCVGSSGQAKGGGRSLGYSRQEAANVLTPSLQGGPAGGGVLSNEGGRGGGTIHLACRDGISIESSGEIVATGSRGVDVGAGGGAGGLIVLASSSFINSQGTLKVSGGDGGLGNSRTAPGGGGSGGIIRLISPQIATNQTIVDGGAAGSAAVVSNAVRCGGGAGGGFGGDGGAGGSALTGVSSVASAASAGSAGVVITTNADPISFFLY